MDPKYANLPGIDDQPDVFETCDLPEDDQAILNDDNDSGNGVIDKIDVSVDEVYNKFKGKYVDGQQVDFSDRVAKASRTGYMISKTEYELLEEAERAKETPELKYERLKHELNDLLVDLENIQERVKEEGSEPKPSAVDLVDSVKYLQQQLHGIQLEKILGTDMAQDIADPYGTLPKRLISHLQCLQSASGDTTPTKDKTPTIDGSCPQVTYELYYRPDASKFQEVSKVAEIEERIAKLEKVLGTDMTKLATVATGGTDSSLVGAVSLLLSRTALLEPQHIDHVEARLQAVLQKLTDVQQKKNEITDSDDLENHKKISELFEMMSRWGQVCDNLPTVVNRLVALKGLHEQTLQFSQALTHLDTIQQQIVNQLGSQSTSLAQLNETFNGNIKTIQANVESLDARMKALQDK